MNKEQRAKDKVGNFKRVFIFFVLCSLGVVPFLSAKQELLDRVVAVVNDDVVTQSELDSYLRPMYEQYSREYSGETMMKMLAEAQDKLLSQLIEDKLVYQEAVKQKITVNETDIEHEMKMFKEKFGSQVELEKALQHENASLADLQERLKKQALIRKLHEQEVRSKVVVSPKELEEYYVAHLGEFETIERVRIASLTIKKSDDSREKGIVDEEAQARLNALIEKIKAGEDFDKIVRENSEDKYSDQDGAGKWIKQKEMIPAVDEAIFKTPAGQMTEIIETPIGYHVFKILEKEKREQKTFEQVREQIYDILFRKKSDEKFDVWIEGLKKNAYISIKGTRV